MESACIEPGRLILVQLLEARSNSCFDRALPQQLGTERVNRADVCFFQPCERIFQMPDFAGTCGCISCVIQFDSQPQPQFAGGLAREGDGDNSVDAGLAGLERIDDPANQFGRLAGACSGFDDKALVKRSSDAFSRLLIAAHGVSRNSSKTARRSDALRWIRVSSYGPQISL